MKNVGAISATLVRQLNETKPDTTYCKGRLFNSNYYINKEQGSDTVTLDASFTSNELRLIAALMDSEKKSKQDTEFVDKAVFQSVMHIFGEILEDVGQGDMPTRGEIAQAHIAYMAAKEQWSSTPTLLSVGACTFKHPTL
jgi:hypothetical protein